MKLPLFPLLCSLGLTLAPIASAQMVDIGKLNTEGLKAMKEGNHEEALAAYTKITSQAKALRLYGPKFGYFWFRRGLCELKLSNYQAAAASFETCYVEFANQPDTPEQKRNNHDLYALLKWGDALLLTDQPKQALAKYEQFRRKVKATPVKYNTHELDLHTSFCHFRIIPRNFSKGTAHFATALEGSNKPAKRPPLSDTAVVTGFYKFCSALVKSSAPAPQREEIFDNFFKTRKSQLRLDSQAAKKLASKFAELANQAQQANLHSLHKTLAPLATP